VRQAYAQMSGNMVSVNSDQDSVTGLASFNSSTGQLSGLVGRAIGCTQDPWCASSWPNSTDAAPTSVTITLTVPWTSGQARVSLSDIPGETLGDTNEPTPVASMANVTPPGPSRFRSPALLMATHTPFPSRKIPRNPQFSGPKDVNNAAFWAPTV
jgi:hypothetical protein